MKHARTDVLIAPLPHRRRVRDGAPFLSVYLDHISFVWTGHFTDPIEVENGEAGEPVVFVIYADPRRPGMGLPQSWGLYAEDQFDAPDPSMVLAWFTEVCQAFLDRLEDQGYEGMRVEEVR